MESHPEKALAVRGCGDNLPHPISIRMKDWPHAPAHRLSGAGVYMVTAATLHKQHLFAGSDKLTLLEDRLLSLSRRYNWQLEAWAVFPNHYHFVARGEASSAALQKLLTHLHADTARELNRIDEEAGRKVWFNFWDTKLTYERSYLSRLSYVHQNAVKHELVKVANQYRWCSAAWFERVATAAMVSTIYNLKVDNLKIADDY